MRRIKETDSLTLKELLAQSVQQHGDTVALRYKEKEHWHTVSYHELLARVRNVAEVLSDFNIKPCDRVAIFSENSPEWPEIYFGIVGMGATAVPVDAKLQEQEVAHILRDSGAKLLVTGAKSYPLLRDIEPHIPDLQTVLLIDGRESPSISSRRIKYLDYEQLLEDVAAAGSRPVRMINGIRKTMTRRRSSTRPVRPAARKARCLRTGISRPTSKAAVRRSASCRPTIFCSCFLSITRSRSRPTCSCRSRSDRRSASWRI